MGYASLGEKAFNISWVEAVSARLTQPDGPQLACRDQLADPRRPNTEQDRNLFCAQQARRRRVSSHRLLPSFEIHGLGFG